MKQDMAISIMQECQVKFDQLLNPESNVDVGDFLNEAHVIADKYDGVNCAMNVTYINGQISSAICIITDMHPGSVAFISYPNGVVNLRLVPPEDHKAFAEAIKPFFDTKYPE